jgi:hypothetical protein
MAQRLAQRTHNPLVVGSNPTGPTKKSPMTQEQLLDLVRQQENPLLLLVGALNLFRKENGFEQDLLTPGFIKEWMVAEILDHDCHKTKHGADAYSKDGTEKYEYLSCKEGGSFQLDRIHKDNLHRVERNDAIYFALFSKADGITCKEIWKCLTDIFLEEVKDRINSARTTTSNHVSVSYNWVQSNCNRVY